MVHIFAHSPGGMEEVESPWRERIKSQEGLFVKASDYAAIAEAAGKAERYLGKMVDNGILAGEECVAALSALRALLEKKT